ncbi:hypothetical protein ABEB36_013550 [Hypothenemus hampei]|uniref:Protein FAM177A1 n=1 Tax=Hypothenemus hampei TaxID=57062 RepID=A0ABD1E5H1_HYPHA
MVLVKSVDYSDETPDPNYIKYRNKIPKRSLTFSDGIMEEYSTDEDEKDMSNTTQLADASKLTWGPWLLYKTWAVGTSTLSFLDYVGEGLASFFGITTPRYYFELEEYKKRQEEEQKQAEKEKGWSEINNEIIELPLELPKNVDQTQQVSERNLHDIGN